ncbi:DUF389 domain-containing protein [Vulcaniibacterium gelatinicum]|uniref:DUF389 domain-containing protein n=1 Tax=Vulcaniibacterium gelatinicum TaxID=2598725 RepID=UPI0011CB2499|nr:DUF389 domain-containing protein [Vulcaniibacterium gelatinicum]
MSLDARVWWRWLRYWRHEHLLVDRVAVIAHVAEAGALGPRYAFMIVMSGGIATLGLLQNSAAVIIGAMLISPLMGPIIEMGMALALFDFRTLRRALITLATGVALALLTAGLIVAASPLREATPEILARTEPTLFDLLVAVFSGLAGAYATITRKGETIVGVAIATALMPPLAVVGYGLATANAAIAGGAAFLFMTNLLAIALSVTIMARWYGFGRSDSPQQTAWQATLIVGSFALLSIPLGLALRDIAARGVAERTLRGVLEEEARKAGGRISALRVERVGQAYALDLVLLTPRHQPQLAAKLERRLEAAITRPVTVSLREVMLADDAQLAQEQAAFAQLRESVAGLQDTVARDRQVRSAREAAIAATREFALAWFGEFEWLDEGQRARWRLSPRAGLDVPTAHALERELSGRDGALPVEVVPALQALPPVPFADDAAGIGDDGRHTIGTAAWALHRWQARAVELRGATADRGALAEARVAAVAEALRKQGFEIARTGRDEEVPAGHVVIAPMLR